MSADSDVSVAGYAFVVGVILGASVFGFATCSSKDDEKMRIIINRCEKIGGTISGKYDVPDDLKPCVVGGKEVF